MSAERSTVMFATRFTERGKRYLAGFMCNERAAKMCFYKPVESCTVRDLREGESSEYWAWWNAKELRFEYVFSSRIQVDMCFPYGSKVEVAKGNGEIVNVFVEESRTLDSLFTVANITNPS